MSSRFTSTQKESHTDGGHGLLLFFPHFSGPTVERLRGYTDAVTTGTPVGFTTVLPVGKHTFTGPGETQDVAAANPGYTNNGLSNLRHSRHSILDHLRLRV